MDLILRAFMGLIGSIVLLRLFTVPLLLIGGFMLPKILGAAPVGRRRLRFLLPPQFIWILIAFWGGWFAVSDNDPNNPDWVLTALYVMLGAQAVSAIMLVCMLPGSRKAAAVFGLASFLMAYAMAFVAGMAVTGRWL